MKNSLSLDYAALAIIMGIMLLIILPRLPTDKECYSLLFIIVILMLVGKPLTLFTALFLVGFVWSSFMASQAVKRTHEYSGQQLKITGIVQHTDIGQQRPQILFRVTQVEQHALSIFSSFNIRLNWPQHAMRIAAGQKWQLTVAIRPIHGLLNQGGFNQQRWAFANHQTLKGYVKQSQLLDEQISLRQQLIDQANIKISELKYGEILLALAFGERALIKPPQRQLLLKTGIAHLMAISGLHISLAALLGFLLARAIQWFFPQQLIGLGFPDGLSWLFALSYMWLSGMNPPALRAMLALTFWLILKHYSVFYSPWQRWLYIVALLLLYDPLMILSDSAWLSCTAVAGLIFWFQWLPLKRQFYQPRWFLIRWLYLQAAMFFLLIPLQIMMFQGISLSGLVCNLIAIPIVSFLTVPTLLMAVFLAWLPGVSHYLWYLSSQSLQLVFSILEQFPHGWLVMPHQAIWFSIISWLALVIWRLQLWRTAFMACFVLVIILRNLSHIRPAYEWRLDMLDVGHGLAIVIHNGSRAIIYDTGNRWQNGTIASQVIMPFLNWHGLTLDGIIISHDDADHAGGLTHLQQHYPQAWLRTPTLSQGQPCIAGQIWYWQQLKFEVLWPKQQVKRAGNANSCVVKVSDDNYKVLLTGDLEKQQELALVSQLPEQLHADILQTPHHGSNSSSSGPFLRKIAPTLALTSISRFNPWRLPAKKVQQRYQSMAITWLSTATTGQISILFFKDKFEIYSLRNDLSHRWYNQWFGDIAQND